MVQLKNMAIQLPNCTINLIKNLETLKNLLNLFQTPKKIPSMAR